MANNQAAVPGPAHAGGAGVLVRRPGPRSRADGDFTPAQGDLARLLIADGGIAPHGKWRNVFDVVSSSGDVRYLTSPNACTCPSGKYRPLAGSCYHSAAARLLAAGTAREARNLAMRQYRRARQEDEANRPERALRYREMARAALALARRIAQEETQ